MGYALQQSVVKKLAIARGIICKFRYYAPIFILRCVYFIFVYSLLPYGVSTGLGKIIIVLDKIVIDHTILL